MLSAHLELQRNTLFDQIHVLTPHVALGIILPVAVLSGG